MSTAIGELIKAVSHRFEGYLNLNNDDAVLAAISHPAFKLKWVSLLTNNSNSEPDKNLEFGQNVNVPEISIEKSTSCARSIALSSRS